MIIYQVRIVVGFCQAEVSRCPMSYNNIYIYIYIYYNIYILYVFIHITYIIYILCYVKHCVVMAENVDMFI